MRSFHLNISRLAIEGFAAAAMVAAANVTVRAAEGPTSGSVKGGADRTYPLAYCAVTSRKLGTARTPFVYSYEGREIKFCCGECPARLEKDPAKYIKMLDDAIIKQRSGTVHRKQPAEREFGRLLLLSSGIPFAPLMNR